MVDAPDIKVSWDIGTAYDFFASLVVLHNPGDFGVRAAWAAGMRQRLPNTERDLLERLTEGLIHSPPMAWLHQLPDPKDSMVALEVMSELSPRERLNMFVHWGDEPDPANEILEEVAELHHWDDHHRDALAAIWEQKMEKKPPIKMVEKNLDTWAAADELGEGLLGSMQAFYESFFAEEERRIKPALDDALERARKLAKKLSLPDLITELSQGVRFSALADTQEIIFVPSFWVTPYIFFNQIGESRMLVMYGARPADASLVPGEVIPDALVNALKALSDPTRLRILRYLAAESLTPTQLANRLRLRTPTVVHHLKALRAAGLIYVLVGEGTEKKEGGYQARIEGIQAVCAMLDGFIFEEGGMD